jgi:hypothetical protein
MLWTIAVVAALVGAWFYYQRWIDRVSRTWPVAEAKLESSSIAKAGRRYILRIGYSYLAGGSPYGGTWYKSFPTEAGAAQLRQSLEETLVLVRFNPDSPDRSYFDPFRDQAEDLTTIP